MHEADRSADIGLAPEEVRTRIAAAVGPAFLIDPDTARVLAGNETSQLHFPALSEGRAVPLDGSMPAVRDVRAWAARNERPARAVPLTFWTARGVRTWRCDLERVALGGKDGVLLIVDMMSGPASSVSGDSALPQPYRSDGETLREIARRIWEGQSRRHSNPDERDASGDSGSNREDDAMSAGPEATDPTGGAAVPSTQPAPETDAALSAPIPHAENAVPLAATDPAQHIDLAKLAHELKTPVSAISAAAEIMKDERFGPVENPRYAGYIADIHSSAQHALTLIERMLTRPSENDLDAPVQAPMHFTRLDLAHLVTECVSSVAPLAEAKGVNLVRAAGRPELIITADATAIRQIVLNLVTNAIKFTPARGRISVETILARDGAPVLRVADTGPGMSAVEIAEAMRPVPLQVPTRRDGGGLGLGLPLAQALADANGATLAIESAPGQGTNITVTFPHGRLIAI